MAARFGGSEEGVYQNHPLHMKVNKPCNINDGDIVDGEPLRDIPIDQPSDMSYFLQRIRLAEISRSIVDHKLMNVTSSDRPSYYAHVMAKDFELEKMMQDVPNFFRLDSYVDKAQRSRTDSGFFQAYMLNSMIHLQRCKLHLAYLTAGPRENPAYVASRHACLESARQIIRGESQLLESNHPFVQVRLRLGAILYGVFIAGIVMLMDTCLHRPASLEHELSRGDLADALRMIRDVKGHSLAAATLHESLMQIIARYRAQQQEKIPVETLHNTTEHGSTPTSVNAPLAGESSCWGTGSIALSDQSAHGQFDDGMGDTIFMDQVQWDDLFTGLASSSFF